jgi:uncharacterized protein (TIGR03435 family)
MKTAAFAIALLGIPAILAQSQSPLAFEVASVKAAPERAGQAALIAMDTDPAMVRYSNVSLKILIAMAYRFDSRLVQGGPAWLDEQPYDLTAKLPPGVSKDRVPEMLRTLLAERFHLVLRRETKEQRVYFLVVAKNGAKLTKARSAEGKDLDQVRGDHPPSQITSGGIMGHSMTMRTLAGNLAILLKTQVVDHTGLTGTFDIDLRYTPEESKDPGPSLFAAIQEQLGLKLETGKGPVEVLVVEGAERIPTGN